MDKKIYHLKESKTFCMLGFVHSHTWPDGRVLPCCAGDINAPQQLGNIYEQSWPDIWNGDAYRELRRNMLDGVEHSLCRYCYDTEKMRDNSMRTNMNNTFGHLYDSVMSTVDDASGYCGSDKLYYLDFRFSNLCNQACITCGHDLSSSWYDLQTDMDPDKNVPDRSKFLIAGNKENPYPAILENSMDSVEVCYFAGGEPLLVPEHWQILEKLIENGRAKDVSLRYSTNLSTLQNKGRHVLDYWKHFKIVNVAGSIDEVGERFHYIRWPADWRRISKNIKGIVDAWNQLPGDSHEMTFSPVVSIMNAHRLKDIVEQWGNEGLLQNTIYINNTFEQLLLDNILRGPAQFYTGNAPDWWWEEHLEPSLDTFQRWFDQNITRHKRNEHIKAESKRIIDTGIKAIKSTRNLDVKSVNSQTGRPGAFDVTYWIDWINRADRARKTSWAETFPELAWMLKEDWRRA